MCGSGRARAGADTFYKDDRDTDDDDQTDTININSSNIAPLQWGS